MGATPTSSNYQSAGASTPGKLVSWDGPDIPCLGLCKKISVTEVVYKMGMKLCSYISDNDLSTLDLKCLVETCMSCPEPVITLKYVLGLMVSRICNHETRIVDLETAPVTGGASPAESLVIILPQSLQYVDSGTDTVVTELPLVSFLNLVGSKTGSLLNTRTQQNTAVEVIQTTLTQLEGLLNGEADPINVFPQYVNTGDPGDVMEITAAFAALETAFGELRNATGTTTAIGQAVSAQIAGLDTLPRLNGAGAMSTIPGWIVSPQTAADAIKNLWLTVGDMRASYIAVLENQLAPDASQIILDFTLVFTEDRTDADFKTTGTIIPYGWVVAEGATLELVDGEAHTYTVPIADIIAFTRNGSTSTLNLQANGLTVTSDITATLTGSFVTADGSIFATKTKVKTFISPCATAPATGLVVDTITSDGFLATWVAPASPPTAVTGYEVKVLLSSGGGWLEVRNDHTTSTTLSFIGLLPSSDYKVTVAAQYACGNSSVITSGTITTTA